jgi:aspartate dehydrogenase
MGMLFEGPTADAVQEFPANVNVAGTLSLTGIGYDATTVRVIADPAVTRNMHEIKVTGEFGALTVRVENVPSPENPKTSYIICHIKLSQTPKTLIFYTIGHISDTKHLKTACLPVIRMDYTSRTIDT